MAKKKYYVVWEGHKPGIYDNWNACLLQTKNYPKAKYKAYLTKKEADKAFEEGFQKHLFKKKDKTTQTSMAKLPSIAVDAACSGNPGLMEYRGVDTHNAQVIFHQGPFKEGTNNVGEFLALVHGISLLHKNKKNIPIYTDSATAMSWVKKKKCNTKLTKTKANQSLFELIDRAEKWLKANRHSIEIIKWDTKNWGEIPADFGRK